MSAVDSMSEHHPLCPFQMDGAWQHDCQCDLIARVRADEKAKADLVISVWEQEATRLRAMLAGLPSTDMLFPGRSVKSTSANVEPSAAVYARAWDEVSEEVMAKVRNCEHLIAVAVREERERIAQALMELKTYHRFVDTDGHVSVRIHDQQQVREDAAKIARGGGGQWTLRI